MKTLLKRLTRDFVDLIMLIIFGGLTIKAALSDANILAIIIGTFFVLYILGTMWRMGDAAYKLNEYVDDNTYRAMIGLRPYEYRNRPLKHDWKEWVFLALCILIFLFYIIFS